MPAIGRTICKPCPPMLNILCVRISRRSSPSQEGQKIFGLQGWRFSEESLSRLRLVLQGFLGGTHFGRHAYLAAQLARKAAGTRDLRTGTHPRTGLATLRDVDSQCPARKSCERSPARLLFLFRARRQRRSQSCRILA